MAEAGSGATANAPAQSSLDDELHAAAKSGDVVRLREALAAGADVDARRTDSYTRTPLARVVDPQKSISDERRTACARALLLAGASPSAPIESHGGRSCWMPLHDAAFLGLYTVCRLLLDAGADADAGADVNVQSNRSVNDTPLHYAANREHQKVIALFLSRGAVDGPHVDQLERSSYLQKVRAAGGFSKYERQHRAMLVASYTPKFSHLLPPELVSVVISFWAHVGFY